MYPSLLPPYMYFPGERLKEGSKHVLCQKDHSIDLKKSGSESFHCRFFSSKLYKDPVGRAGDTTSRSTEGQGARIILQDVVADYTFCT